jgi:hypothetical protein
MSKPAVIALRIVVTLLAVSTVHPAEARGQSNTATGGRSNTRIGLAAGVSLSEGGGRHESFAAEQTINRRWLAIRAEMMWVHWAGNNGPVSATADAVVPVLRKPLSPYAIGGVGVYGIGAVGRQMSYNAGAGLRYDSREVRYYAEVRAHPASRTLLSLGVMLGVR